MQKSLLEAEQSLFGDIVILNQFDSYYNLTLKMLMAYSWLEHYCSSSIFVYKIDDDVYVNLENMEKRMVFLLKKVQLVMLSIHSGFNSLHVYLLRTMYFFPREITSFLS